jgi:histidyl-tRNA synthetase
LFGFLSEKQQKEFGDLCMLFDQYGISYDWDKKLIRGLDYYNNFCFEYLVKERENLAQNAIIGGGRYDSLYSRMGGPPKLNVFSTGFALGLDRMIGLLFLF